MIDALPVSPFACNVHALDSDGVRSQNRAQHTTSAEAWKGSTIGVKVIMLKLGVIGTSRKEDEKRVAIHPEHLGRISAELRERIFFEKGYGEPFGMADGELAAQCGGLRGREELFESSDIVLVPKPSVEDFQSARIGGTVWGWPHCVQQRPVTQTAIDRKLTLIAFEEMFAWGPQGQWGLHTFYKNNEMAGYCAVLHALQLTGSDGLYGKAGKVVIFGFGSVGRGAIYALRARGYTDITVCIVRPDWVLREEVPGCSYLRMRPRGESMVVETAAGKERPLVEILCEADLLVNGIFQDPSNPVMFVSAAESVELKSGCLIVDVSCDEGMGFPFAKPTSFAEPTFKVGQLDYYAVDHTPTYLWKSASWEISKALLPFLPTVMGGPESWQQNETIRRAIEIQDGTIRNEKILTFQNRSSEYPHEVLPD
jgi:N5-(carboxyethyl)ornithine synthase